MYLSNGAFGTLGFGTQREQRGGVLRFREVELGASIHRALLDASLSRELNLASFYSS